MTRAVFWSLCAFLAICTCIQCSSGSGASGQNGDAAVAGGDGGGGGVCTPDCTCKLCGEDDGCGDRCDKPCRNPGHICTTKEHVCCIPDCEGRLCGDDDGCSGRCMGCPQGEVCNSASWTCSELCVPQCDGHLCGDDDGCGGRCTRCPSDQRCNAKTWTCEKYCAPKCDQKLCGEDDGCGGNCKACGAGEDCNVNAWKCEICSLPDAGVDHPDAGYDAGSTSACKSNLDCTTAGKTCCNMSSYQCVACTPVDGGNDDDGGGATDAGGGCQLKIDCPVTQWCKADAKACLDMGTCASDDECALNHLCNSFIHSCECVDDNSCANWPDNKISCDPNLKQCAVKTDPTCNPSCDASCKECKNGVCMFMSGKECCGDNDCVTAPKLSCDTITYTCYEKHNCADQCTNDAECRNWCGSAVYKCSGSACVAPTGGLCADCSTDSTVCAAAGLTCGTFAKTCTKKCASTADCGDSYGQFYVCNDMVKMCNCQQASCCAPACQAGQTCDEGATCTCQ